MITPYDAAELVIPWRKSRYSNGGDNCVEVAPTHDSRVAIRHSQHPEQPPQTYPRNEWAAFLADTKNGEFDLLTAAVRSGSQSPVGSGELNTHQRAQRSTGSSTKDATALPLPTS